MATELMTYLKGKKCNGRTGKPLYFEDGDFVTFYCADDMAHEVRLDEVVTIYQSFQTGNMVGCKIKGIKHLLSTIGNFGVLIHDHGSQIVLGMLFMVAALANPEKQEKYKDLGRRFGNVPFEPPSANRGRPPRRRDMSTETVTLKNIVRPGYLSEPLTDRANHSKYHYLHLLIVKEESDEFSAIVLNLLGSGSCGATEKEAIENAKIAVRETLIVYAETGEEVPWGEDESRELPKDAKTLWVVLDA